MSEQNLRSTWETYADAWKTTSATERLATLKKALASDNRYTDPLMQTKGYEELSDYMAQFQEQFPGCYFETKYFLQHNGRSMARWDMKNDKGEAVSEGTSFAEYNHKGLLVAETGFYETPEE